MKLKTLVELAQQSDVQPSQIANGKAQLMERSAQMFGDSPAKAGLLSATKLTTQTYQVTTAQLAVNTKVEERSFTQPKPLATVQEIMHMHCNGLFVEQHDTVLRRFMAARNRPGVIQPQGHLMVGAAHR